MNNMTRALAILDCLTPSVTAQSNPLSGAVLAALAKARIAARRHWQDVAAEAFISMQTACERLTAARTPSWREHLPANADWQILVDTCGNALCALGSFAVCQAYHKCHEAGSWMC